MEIVLFSFIPKKPWLPRRRTMKTVNVIERPGGGGGGDGND